MYEYEIEVLEEFLNYPPSSTDAVFDKFKNSLRDFTFREKPNGEGLEKKKRFLFMEGTRENKVLLVAHADTYVDMVYSRSNYSLENHDVYSLDGLYKARDAKIPEKPQLLGADDRAGLAMLWLLKDSGHSLLVTDGEEGDGKGGRIGSNWLVDNNRDIAEKINSSHQFMIQLDRRNGTDFKCYQVGTEEFSDYIAKETGYIEDRSSGKTDICTLCENICGVNFSIGYYNEHNNNEYLNIDDWRKTYDLVTRILEKDPLPAFYLTNES